MLEIILSLLQNLGVSLSVGSSTFALIFYFKATEDGTIDPSEKRFMHTVYFVLRIGLITIIVTELLFVSLALLDGSIQSIVSDPFWFKWLLLGVIVANAFLMQFHKMPMWLGPALAGGSWYMLFIVHTLKNLPVSFSSWSLYYVLFVTGFIFLLRAIKRIYVEKRSA